MSADALTFLSRLAPEEQAGLPAFPSARGAGECDLYPSRALA